MTCVLPMTSINTNPFNEECMKLQNTNWINNEKSSSGLSNNHEYFNPYPTKPSAVLSFSHQIGTPNGTTGCDNWAKLNIYNEKGNENGFETYQNVTNLENDVPLNGMLRKTELDNFAKNVGVKRKAEVTELDEVCVPSKRISPYLNTSKERKDEQKKLLIISIKKLKEVDDAEAFLRRTVLVNNTRKRLQMEYLEENRRTVTYKSYRRKHFTGYGVLYNCISNSCSFDDPIFSCVQEKITDDMTDTLIKNVFHDKARIHESDVGEKLDKASNEIDLSLTTSVAGSEGKSNRSSSNVKIAASRKEFSILACLNNRNDLQEMSFDRFDEIVTANTCNLNGDADISKNVCNDHWQTMLVGKGTKETVKSCIDIKELHTSQNTELHAENAVAAEKTKN